MTAPYLSIELLERRLATGNVESLRFSVGVNLLVGRPNTGKTKWLATLDFLLGDTGENPFYGIEDESVATKYDAASAVIRIGLERFHIERKWREAGSKTKVFVGNEGMNARDFQVWLMQKLEIPLLSFPKGNPMSGQTWPILSFRMLLRHIYRQQDFWGQIADQQPDGEQHACVLQMLGLAEYIYTPEYGDLINLRMKSEKLKSRRDQFIDTLNDVSRDVISDSGLTVNVTSSSIKTALLNVSTETSVFREKRSAIIHDGRDIAIPADQRGYVEVLSEKRASCLNVVEEQSRKLNAVSERFEEIRVYRDDLADEIERMDRVEDARSVLADLRITHCPACDQVIEENSLNPDECFLCHQVLPDEPIAEELGAARLRFESDRLNGELKEANELLDVLQRDRQQISKSLVDIRENLRTIENELVPARAAIGALIQAEISAIDVALGQLSERERQIIRILETLNLGEEMTERVRQLESSIEQLQKQVDESSRSIDFEAACNLLEDGMNEYINSINRLRPGVWSHSQVNIDISRYSFSLRIGRRRWQAALGGTDKLYFLMSYHYGLLTLSNKTGCHYPGLSIIDVPGEFSGEAVEDKENFIVQPFIDLLENEEYFGAQIILTGASFAGLQGAHFEKLHHVHAS